MVVITSSMFNVLSSLLRMIEVYNIIQIHMCIIIIIMHYRIILYTFHTHTQSCVYISNDALLMLHVFLYLFRMSKYKW